MSFPVDIRCNLPRRPKAVFVAEVRERATNAAVYHQGLDWDWVTKRDASGTPVPHIRVRDIYGLPGSKSYRIRLLAVLE